MEISDNYVLDINNIMRFCFDYDDKPNDSELTEIYVYDEMNKNLTLTSKQVREVKSGDVSSKQTMKYDLIKTLIANLTEIDKDNPTLGDLIILNTMITEGLLKKID